MTKGVENASLWRGLKLLREAKGLLSKDVAEKMDVSASYLSEIENNKRPLTDSFLSRLAEAYCISVGELTAALAEQLEALAPLSMNEPTPPYRYQPVPQPFPPSGESDLEILCRWLVSQITREKLFDLVVKFTEDAKAGDTLAARKASALLLLSSQPKEE